MEWLTDAPNWVKPLPGLALLAISFFLYLNGWIWFWGWGGGMVLFCAGILFMKKKGDYNF